MDIADRDLLEIWERHNVGNRMVANYENLKVLHDWLYHNAPRLRAEHRKPYEAGMWAGKYSGEQDVTAMFISNSPSTDDYDTMCVFGWAAASKVKALRIGDQDIAPVETNGRHYIHWARYIERVFGLNMGMPEYNFINSVRWRKHPDGLDGAIARIRFVIDNALDMLINSEVLDVISGKTETPYDTLENRPYECNDEI